MLSTTMLALIGCGGGAETETKAAVVNPAQPVSDWQLIWSDEFEGGSPDSRYWTYEEGLVRNRELQWYQAEDAFVSKKN